MPNDLDRLNNQAADAFSRIRDKTIWRAISANVLSNRPVNREQTEQAIKAVSDSLYDNTDKVIELIDETTTNKAKSVLEFLDSIELDNELKIAISYIIASNDKDKRANLNKAIMIIEERFKEL